MQLFNGTGNFIVCAELSKYKSFQNYKLSLIDWGKGLNLGDIFERATILSQVLCGKNDLAWLSYKSCTDDTTSSELVSIGEIRKWSSLWSICFLFS